MGIRAERAQTAALKAQDDEKQFHDQIQDIVSKTQIYRNGSSFKNEKKTLKNLEKIPVHQYVYNLSTYSLLLNIINSEYKDYYKDKKIAVLDFASYCNPADAYIRGLGGQEAELCENSFLYNILDNFRDTYYVENQRKKNWSLYTDSALYIPDVPFKDMDFPVNIIACSAPNMRAYYKKRDSYKTSQSPSIAIDNRIKFIKDICELNNIQVLITGAWGCGYCGYKASIISRYWNDIFRNNFSTSLKTIFYAIPNNTPGFNKGFNKDNPVNEKCNQFNNKIQTFFELPKDIIKRLDSRLEFYGGSANEID